MEVTPSDTSHSQSGEDLYLLDRYLRQLFPDGGVYFEAGAMDGVRYSNTKLLADEHGWTGVLVEPHPLNFELLEANRPDDRCFDCAISSEKGSIDFVYFENPKLAAVSGVPETFPERLRSKFYESDDDWMQQQRASSLVETSVPTRTLDWILRESGVERVNLASLDLEGHELSALRSYSGQVPIDLLLVELNGLAIGAHLATLGYVEIDRIANNQLFASPEMLESDLIQARRLQFRFTDIGQPGTANGGLVDHVALRSQLVEAGVSTEEWPAIVSRDEAADEFEGFEAIDRTASIGDPDHHFIFGESVRRCPASPGFVIEDARLSFDVTSAYRPTFYVFDAAGRLVDGLGWGAAPFLDEPSERIGSATFVDDRFVRFNICHLAVDKLPRAMCARAQTGVATAAVFAGGEYVRALGELVGIEVTELAGERTRGTVRFEQLVVFADSFRRVAHPLHFGAATHLDCIEQLRTAARAIKRRPWHRRPPTRLFVHRQLARSRRAANFAELEAALNDRGIAVVDPASMAPRDQFAMFAGAELVVGVHGAGLTNALFMQPGGALVEILPQMVATRAYADLADAASLDYRYQVAAAADVGFLDPAETYLDLAQRPDVVVDIEHLLGLIDGSVPSGLPAR